MIRRTGFVTFHVCRFAMLLGSHLVGRTPLRDEKKFRAIGERRRDSHATFISLELEASSIIAFAGARRVIPIISKWRSQDLRQRLLCSIGRAIVLATGKADSRVMGDQAKSRHEPTHNNPDLAEAVDVDAPAPDAATLRWRGYLSGVLIAAVCTALAAIMST